jgi:uncharacterized membrane protein YsdA (DUF1294 family)/cold shock CspA family protein
MRASTEPVVGIRFEGRLKSWTEDRGFGFIEPDQGGQEIFVHIKSLPAGFGRPRLDMRLSFEVELNPQGKKRAANVAIVRPMRAARPARGEPPARWGMASRLAIPAFVAVYIGVSAAWGVRAWVALAYLTLSIVCFFAYALDKSAARRGAWRTPESTLLMLGLACGWPGAILAQQLFRHKSNKPSFRAAFWASVVVNVACFVLWHSPLLARLRP